MSYYSYAHILFAASLFPLPPSPQDFYRQLQMASFFRPHDVVLYRVQHESQLSSCLVNSVWDTTFTGFQWVISTKMEALKDMTCLLFPTLCSLIPAFCLCISEHGDKERWQSTLFANTWEKLLINQWVITWPGAKHLLNLLFVVPQKKHFCHFFVMLCQFIHALIGRERVCLGVTGIRSPELLLFTIGTQHFLII